MDMSRQSAIKILAAILDKQTPLDDALAAIGTGLEPRDRAFVRQLVTTTLRRLGQIDCLVDVCLKKIPGF